jgi:amino acid transporter
MWNRAWRTKPCEVVNLTLLEQPQGESSEQHSLKRHLTLRDLLAIGIGGTVGTGIFALSGLIAREYAGTAAPLCFLIAGVASLLSGFSYMELSSRIPCAGSTYAYAYSALGELAAVLAGFCLSLEYGVSGAAVARSWAEKVTRLFQSSKNSKEINMILNDLDYPYANVLAALLQFVCVLILLAGIGIGKSTVNYMTILKMTLILFMCIAAFCAFNWNNLDFGEFPPSSSQGHRYGWAGVGLGSTVAFFGFIGFDEVSCLAAEAKNPSKVMPQAVIGTIVGTTVISVVASVALIGMQKFTQIDSYASFGYAFNSNNMRWAGLISEIGEVISLPVVVLIAFLAQPRLLFAMADDGLLPKCFSRTDKCGVLMTGTWISGLVCTVLAFCVPFDNLNDLCSAGVLLSFSLSNASALILRLKDTEKYSPVGNPTLIKVNLWLVAIFTISSGISAFCFLKFFSKSLLFWIAFGFFSLITVLSLIMLLFVFPSPVKDVAHFVAPGFPLFPLASIAVNWILIFQLSALGLCLLLVYLALGALTYFLYGIRHSVANSNSWHKLLIENGLLCRCSLCTSAETQQLFIERLCASSATSSDSEDDQVGLLSPESF